MVTVPDGVRAEGFVTKVVADLGGGASAVLLLIGDRLGFYRSMAGAGPLTSSELARRTGTAERYVREWLNSQVAGGYVSYDASARTYLLPEEHVVTLVEASSLVGAFEVLATMFASTSVVAEAFRTGRGLSSDEYSPSREEGLGRLTQPCARLLTELVPTLDGVERLLHGAGRVAVIGHGIDMVAIALAAHLRTTVRGFLEDELSVERARKVSAESGVADRTSFEVARRHDFPGDSYDLVCTVLCLQDAGDPTRTARHVLSALAPDGAWLLVEPRAEDRLEDNCTAVGRFLYSFSTVVSIPASLGEEVGSALGAQAGPARIRRVVTEAGFSRFSEVAESLFYRVYQARR